MSCGLWTVGRGLWAVGGRGGNNCILFSQFSMRVLSIDDLYNIYVQSNSDAKMVSDSHLGVYVDIREVSEGYGPTDGHASLWRWAVSEWSQMVANGLGWEVPLLGPASIPH